MARRQYVIDGEIFETQAELRARIQSVLRAYPVGATVSEEHCRFLSAVLAHHPRADAKIGAGIRRMFVERNPPWQPAFWLERTDGTRTEWSFVKCLHPSSPFSEFRDACREAIQDQKFAFRDAFFSRPGEPRCAISGVLLTVDTSHVDHIAPATFDALVSGFIADANLDLATVRVVGRGDREVERRLADHALSVRWQAFHAAHARLRVVEKRAHLTLPRGPRNSGDAKRR